MDDALGKAPSVETPALVVHGTADDWSPDVQGQRVAKALPHGTLFEVPHTDRFTGGSAWV